MNAPVWIVGRGGLLGSHIAKELARGDKTLFEPESFSWKNEKKLREEFAAAAETYRKRMMKDGATQWMIMWTAGAGVMGTDENEMRGETESFRMFLKALDESGLADEAGTLFFASTAGAMYARESAGTIDETREPSPSSAYGMQKLAQEELLRDWTQRHDNIRSMIGRISNLYGPGQNVRKRQGLISHFSRSILLNVPLQIYVPLDTIRDYYFVNDCARHIVSCTEKMANEGENGVTLKLFAAEKNTTIAEIMGIFRRLAKKSPRVITAKNRLTDAYVRKIKFRSGVWRETKPASLTSLASGISAVHGHMLTSLRRGSFRVTKAEDR